MSERNESNGQFTSAEPTEPLTGQLGVEADMGFKPMPDPLKDDDEAVISSIEAEAARLSLARELTSEDPQDIELGYLTPTGEKVDPAETISIERATKDLSSFHAATAEDRAKTVSAEFASAIDEMRAAAIRENPDLAEHFGLDAGEVLAKAEEKAPAKTVAEEQYTPGLDPEVEKALRHPQVREAIENELAESAAARERYTQGLDQLKQVQLASFLADWPEMNGFTLEQIGAALPILQNTQPQRFNASMGKLQTAATIEAEQQRLQQQQAAIQNAQFETTVAAEDEKLVRMFGGDKSQADAANNAAIAYLKENGVPREQLLNVFRNNPVLQTAEGRRTLWEAAQYRQMKSALPKAAPKSLPPVQKPGSRSGPATRSDNSSTIASLQRELSSASGNKAIKIAARLQAAKRS